VRRSRAQTAFCRREERVIDPQASGALRPPPLPTSQKSRRQSPRLYSSTYYNQRLLYSADAPVLPPCAPCRRRHNGIDQATCRIIHTHKGGPSTNIDEDDKTFDSAVTLPTSSPRQKNQERTRYTTKDRPSIDPPPVVENWSSLSLSIVAGRVKDMQQATNQIGRNTTHRAKKMIPSRTAGSKLVQRKMGETTLEKERKFPGNAELKSARRL